MQDLRVIGVESGALLVASDDGARFRVAIDDSVQSRLRQSSSDVGEARKLAPREIQAHIRAGMSAEDVAAVTGAPIDYIKRFEGPVLAEREFVIESALNVPVQVGADSDPLATAPTFGSVIRRRLADASALGERWASWKEDGGAWVVKLTFVAGEVERDARWTFDPKRQTLAPANQEAVSLSQQGDTPASLLPRLRAVPADQAAVEDADGRRRFDSGAFEPPAPDDRVEDDGAEEPAAPRGPEPIRFDRGEVPPAPRGHQTADLLEALRKRRGERDPMDPEHDPSLASTTTTGVVKLIEVPTAPTDEPVPSTSTPSAGRQTGPVGKKRGRAAMPSWDEIVFGARPDDE